jgi:hypothetical protein
MDSNPVQRKSSYLGGVISRDGISGVLLILVGALTLYLNRGLAYGSPTAMGPGFFPRLLSIALVLAGLWILIRGMVNGQRDFGLGDIAAAPWRGLVVVSVSIVIFAFILETAGLFVSGALLIFGTSLASQRIRWIESIVFALTMSFAVGAIFVWGLKVTIPLWPIL